MPKVDRQGAKVRSAAAFVTFCAKKLSDAQQKPSSNRRIAGSQSPKRRNRVHCQQTISALGYSQAKQVRENFLPVKLHAAIIHCGDKFLFFACCRLLRVEKVIWQQSSTA